MSTMLCGALAGQEEEDGGRKAGAIRMLLVLVAFCPVTPTPVATVPVVIGE